MKKTDRHIQEQFTGLLRLNTPPDIDTAKKKELLIQLNYAVRKMDYQNPQFFTEQVLTQVTCISPWVWIFQAGILAMLFYCGYQSQHYYMTIYLLFLAPCLTMILLWEMSRILSHNMWEMEAACRYNLPRLFFFRLCILSGTDFLVLCGALLSFRMTGGLLWQFSFCVLLPFFLTASFCLWILGRMGGCVNIAGLTAVCLILFGIWSSLISCPPLSADLFPKAQADAAQMVAQKTNPGLLPGVTLWATLAALALFLLSAFRLCTKQYYETNRKDDSIWSLE